MSLRYPICLILCAILVGCATQSSSPRLATSALNRSDPSYSTRYRIVNAAEQLLGTPYRLGGATPAGIDCSGLVQYAYHQAGMSVPRTAEQLYYTGKRLDYIRPGDLLFFRNGSTGISHVGIYAGNGQMIHASVSARRVSKVNINQAYWRRHLAGGATFLASQ